MGPKYSSLKLKALCREDCSGHTIFCRRKTREFGPVFLTPCQGVFGIRGSLLHLRSTFIPPTSPVLLWPFSVGLGVASGPERFCSQVRGHTHIKHVPQTDGAVAVPMGRSESPSLKRAVLPEQEGREQRSSSCWYLTAVKYTGALQQRPDPASLVLATVMLFAAGSRRILAKIPLRARRGAG